ncbi:MAG: elongation factor P [Balneolaceae bacterium]
MAKIDTSEFRNGLNLVLDGEIYSIVEFQHVKPGKGGAFVRTRLKGVENDKNIEKTFRAGEKAESVRIESHPYQYLYVDGEICYFMHQETCEQIPLEIARVERHQFINDGDICTLVIDVENDTVLYAQPPDHVSGIVAQTDPGLKGDTAQGGSKPATLESGATVQVPLFINEGDLIRVDTRTGDYVERVNSN